MQRGQICLGQRLPGPREQKLRELAPAEAFERSDGGALARKTPGEKLVQDRSRARAPYRGTRPRSGRARGAAQTQRM